MLLRLPRKNDEDRILTIKKAQIELKSFIDSMMNFHIVPKEIIQMCIRTEEPKDFAIRRQEKIMSFKLMKEAKAKAQVRFFFSFLFSIFFSSFFKFYFQELFFFKFYLCIIHFLFTSLYHFLIISLIDIYHTLSYSHIYTHINPLLSKHLQQQLQLHSQKSENEESEIERDWALAQLNINILAAAALLQVCFIFIFIFICFIHSLLLYLY